MKSLIAGFVVVCSVFVGPSAAAGSSFDTFVSSTGADTGSCARSAPCASFTYAFSQVAVNGIIHVVDHGEYSGLTITHGITIDGGNIAGTLFPGGNNYNIGSQFAVAAGASDVVTIANFTMSGENRFAFPQSSAIGVTSVGALHVQHCTFVGFGTTAVDFRATGALLDMQDVTIMDMPSGTGVYVANARALLDNVAVHHLQTGVIAAGSSTVSIRKSTANGNAAAFVAAYGPTAQLNVDDCMMTNNQWAVVVSQGATAYVGRSSFFNNGITALFNDGASFAISYGTNQFAGNASDGTFTSGMALK